MQIVLSLNLCLSSKVTFPTGRLKLNRGPAEEKCHPSCSSSSLRFNSIFLSLPEEQTRHIPINKRNDDDHEHLLINYATEGRVNPSAWNLCQFVMLQLIFRSICKSPRLHLCTGKLKTVYSEGTLTFPFHPHCTVKCE